MTYTLRFTKASGAGNDFVILEGFRQDIPADRGALARAVCHRQHGVGADGMLVLEPSGNTDFRMSYHNADGSYGGMCGNGGRCASMFAHLTGLAGAMLTFEALDHIYAAHIAGDGVRLRMKDPGLFRPMSVEMPEGTHEGYFVDTGSPHFVIICHDVDKVDVNSIGAGLRHHAAFEPAGTNVDFVSMNGEDAIRLRTYERGVENETLACGTGSVAGALIGAWKLGLSSPVRVRARSGEDLVVHFSSSRGGFTDIVLEGPALMLFDGELEYSEDTGTIRSQPRISL